jgi:hypothetical protein
MLLCISTSTQAITKADGTNNSYNERMWEVTLILNGQPAKVMQKYGLKWQIIQFGEDHCDVLLWNNEADTCDVDIKEFQDLYRETNRDNWGTYTRIDEYNSNGV